jgi:hypothetical protein
MGRPKKKWVDCVKDMRIKGMSIEMTSDRREWKKKTCCADPTYWNKGMMMMMKDTEKTSRRTNG